MKPNGARWRDLRNGLDLDARAVAPALRITTGTLCNIESSQPRATVSERLVRRAAKFYGVDPRELVQTEDPVTEPPSKKQDQEQPKQPGRKESAGTGPKRLQDRRVS